MEIGVRLKEAREKSGISLDHLQETTKIQKRYLLAIEEGNLHLLPGKFYARAFIKEYATAVGLDPDELLRSYEEVALSSEDDAETQHSRIHRTRQEDRSSRSPVILSIVPKLIVGLLIIGIIFAAMYFYQKQMSTGEREKVEQPDTDEIIRGNDNLQEQPKEKEQENEEDEDDEEDEEDTGEDDQDADLEEEEEDSEDPDLALIETGTGNRPESTLELNHPEEEIILTFNPTGISWIDVKNEEGVSLLGANTTANTPIDLDVSDQTRIRINIGNITELPVISISGIDIEYPTDSMTQSFWININKSSE